MWVCFHFLFPDTSSIWWVPFGTFNDLDDLGEFRSHVVARLDDAATGAWEMPTSQWDDVGNSLNYMTT